MVVFGVADPGLLFGSGDRRSLYLKMFANEVLLAFERFTVTDGRVREKRITAGKSHQFPVFGTAKAGFHTPGENIITTDVNGAVHLGTAAAPRYLSRPRQGEKIISIDGFMLSTTMIPDVDEALSHYDVRQPYAREMGWALAKELDVRTLMTIFFGSEEAGSGLGTSTTFDGTGDGGDGSWFSPSARQLTRATFETDVAVTRETVQQIAQNMDENDVPEWGRHIAMRPAAYHLLADEDDIVSADYNITTRGDRGTATVLMLHGIHLHKTNRITDLRAKGIYTKGSQEFGDDYETTYSNAVAVAWQEEMAVGIVKLRDMALMSQDKLEWLATLMVSGYQCGHGVLHEAACYSVITA